MGILQKTGKFLGIEKFGQGIATAGRVITGKTGEDIKRLEENTEKSSKLFYAYKQEQNPVKKKKLLELASSQGKLGQELDPAKIDPGLNLSNKEIIGSAANVVLNVATPGAFKGGQAIKGASGLSNLARTAGPVIGKNAILGGGYGTASGLEKDRSAKGIVGSTVGGAVIGAGIGVVGLAAKAAKDFIGKNVPEWMMNKAVKPALQDLKKNVRFGTKTLGQELLDEGVKGGPKKLLEIADSKLTSLEDDLQKVLTSPEVANKVITKDKIAPYLTDLLEQKAGTPGMKGDVQRIKNIFDSIPESMTIGEANIMKRRIYKELRDISYKLDAKLSTKAGVLKQVASALKTEIEDAVGGNIVRDINKKLSIYGRLENSMVDQLAREMRNNGVGLTDAILLAGGDVTSVLALLRHVGQGTETYAAQALSKVSEIGTGKTAQLAKGIIKRGALNLP